MRFYFCAKISDRSVVAIFPRPPVFFNRRRDQSIKVEEFQQTNMVLTESKVRPTISITNLLNPPRSTIAYLSPWEKKSPPTIEFPTPECPIVGCFSMKQSHFFTNGY
jgi:hypothetical protein